MDKRIINLLDKYYENGHLDSFQMEELVSLADSEEEASNLLELMSDFGITMEVYGKNKLKEELMDMDSIENGEAELAPQDYTSIPEAALKTYFADKPVYSLMIQSNSRGLPLTFEFPENGFEWNEERMLFSLQDVYKELLSYSIENNKGDTLIDGQIELEESYFSILFDWESYLPGRYYLRLVVNRSLMIFEFFIRKDLMPD